MNLGSILGVGCICRSFPAGLTTPSGGHQPRSVDLSTWTVQTHESRYFGKYVGHLAAQRARSHVLGYAPGLFGESPNPLGESPNPLGESPNPAIGLWARSKKWSSRMSHDIFSADHHAPSCGIALAGFCVFHPVQLKSHFGYPVARKSTTPTPGHEHIT
jgi:hypothetical protein